MSTPSVLVLLPCAALFALSAAAELRGAQTAALEQRLPQGTSRLSADERLRAARLAAKSIEEAGLRTDERLYLVSVNGFHDKKSSDPKARVIHYRTDGDLTLVHRINLAKNAIEHFERASGRPTGLSREEFERARELALADPRVRAALGKRRDLEVEPMVLVGGGSTRLVRLLFKSGRNYLSRPVVFVDLVAEKVELEQIDPDAPQ